MTSPTVLATPGLRVGVADNDEFAYGREARADQLLKYSGSDLRRDRGNAPHHSQTRAKAPRLSAMTRGLRTIERSGSATECPPQVASYFAVVSVSGGVSHLQGFLATIESIKCLCPQNSDSAVVRLDRHHQVVLDLNIMGIRPWRVHSVQSLKTAARIPHPIEPGRHPSMASRDPPHLEASCGRDGDHRAPCGSRYQSPVYRHGRSRREARYPHGGRARQGITRDHSSTNSAEAGPQS